MEKKDLTKEQLVDLLNCEDSCLRSAALGYCIRQILNENKPPVDTVLLRQNIAQIYLNEQCSVFKQETENLTEPQYPIFFRLIYGLSYEANVIAYVLFRSKDNRLDKLCLQRLNNLRGTEDENYIISVLFFRAIDSHFFEKKLTYRMRHLSNQLISWRKLTDYMINFKNTPEIIRMKIILAGLIAQSRNMENFNNVCSFLLEFPTETEDLAVTAINHFSQIGYFNSENIQQIERLWNDKVLGTTGFRDKISKILLPSFAVNSSVTMTPVRKLYADNIIAKKEFLQALEDLNSIPVTRNSSYALLFMLNQFIDEIPQEDTELCLKYCEYAIQLVHAGAAGFNRVEMQYAFLLIRKIEKISFVLACEPPAIYLNLLCSKAQNTQEQITGILAFADENPQYLSLTLDKIDFRLAPVDAQIIYQLRNNYGKSNNPTIKIHYLTALETIAQRTDLNNNAQFALDLDVVPQLGLNKAQFQTFPNLRKAYERCQARKNLLNLLT